MNLTQANDLVLLVSPDEKRFLVRLVAGAQMHTHRGFIPHDAIIGKPFGDAVATQMGHPFLILQPSTFNLVMHVKRASQIVYPKEIGHIILRMNIVPGSRIVEAGTGSGALTLALARIARPNGRIFTYEERDDMRELARKNFERAGVMDVIELKARDIRAGFDERDADALFLDVREPWQFLSQAHAALKGGGFFGSLVPTTNQISDLLAEMERLGGWAEIEVIEIFERNYKVNAERLRPFDRMIAHTGYLIFARAVTREMKSAVAGEPADEDEKEKAERIDQEADDGERKAEKMKHMPRNLKANAPRTSDELVAVYTSSGLLGAEVVKGKLESEGVAAMLKYESAVTMIPLTVDGMGEVKVLVRAEDEEKARKILE